MSRRPAVLVARSQQLTCRYVRDGAVRRAGAGGAASGSPQTPRPRRLRQVGAGPGAEVRSDPRLRVVDTPRGPRLQVRDTGIDVDAVLALWRAGCPRSQVHRMCPRLTAEDLTACAEFGLRQRAPRRAA